MPQPTKNAPDLIDVQNLCTTLGEEYHVVVYFTTRLRSDKVEIIGKTVGPPYSPDAPVEHVAMVSFPVKLPKDLASSYFTICWDLWCQHDGAGATAARRGAPTTWRGYPEVPRGRKH